MKHLLMQERPVALHGLVAGSDRIPTGRRNSQKLPNPRRFAGYQDRQPLQPTHQA